MTEDSAPVLRVGMATDVGRVREGNEDNLLVAEDAGLWAVADGMGGHRGGEVASEIAIRTLREAFVAVPPTEIGLAGAAAAANNAIRAAADDDPELQGMGTTLVAIARTEGEDLIYLNVGDSRIYLLRDGQLDRLTTDHSLVEELVQEGSLTPEEARTHPKRNIVSRALGIIDQVPVDTAAITPYRGDRFLLCSDGLTDELDDEGMASVLRRLADPTEAADELVRLALENGGRDNVTVVVVDVVDDDGKAEAASRAVARSPGSDDLAGFSTAVAARADADADGATPKAAAAPSRRERRRRRDGDAPPRRVTWRVGLFALLLLAVLGAAAGAVGWYARNTYFVGVRDDVVTIFKGKPGGVLWFDPTVEQVTDLGPTDLEAPVRDDVARGVEFGDLAAARAFLDRNTTTTTTTTTTTSTTTATTTTTALPPVPPVPTPPP